MTLCDRLRTELAQKLTDGILTDEALATLVTEVLAGPDTLQRQQVVALLARNS